MNQTKSRTENVVRNSYWAIASTGISVILGLITRKVFLLYLDVELLGVNSLFSDVFMLFSFAELGFGTAIIFSMYKPIAESDDEKVSSMLLFYRDIYNYVIGVLILISLCFIPYLKTIKTDIPFNDLVIYYVIFQIGNIFSYVWAYRESYVIACQQERRLTVISIGYVVIKNLAQIILLFIYGNFYIFLLLGLTCNILKKIITNEYIKRAYPITLLKGAQELPKGEKKAILRKTYALLVTRISNLAINQTDSLIVSTFINVTQWGVASNYVLIKNCVFSVTNKLYSSMLPSMGNLVATSDRKKVLETFLKYDFYNAWIYTFFFVSLSVLSSGFISIFFGESLTLPNVFLFIFFGAAFVDGLRSPVSLMREATGTFEVDKWYSVLAAFVNIITSIPLAIIYGLPGVFVGTICSMTVLHVFRTLVLFKDGNYNMTVSGYLWILFKHVVVGVLLLFVTHIIVVSISRVLNCNSIILFVVQCVLAVIIPNFLWVFLYHRNPHYHEIKNKIIYRLWKKV